MLEKSFYIETIVFTEIDIIKLLSYEEVIKNHAARKYS